MDAHYSPDVRTPLTQPPALFRGAVQEHLALFEKLTDLEPQVARIGARLAEVLRGGGKIMWCGNGGSAADSQHIAAELTGRLINDRRPLAGLALSTDSSALTCIGNDYGFDAIFERQVRALGRAGDALVLISTSGRSPNLLRAAEAAHAMGITVSACSGAMAARCARFATTWRSCPATPPRASRKRISSSGIAGAA